MYINRPLLSSNNQKHLRNYNDKNQKDAKNNNQPYQFSKLNHQNNSNKNNNFSDISLSLFPQIQNLFQKYQKSQKAILSLIQYNSSINKQQIPQHQLQSFQRCQYLLQQQNQSHQHSHLNFIAQLNQNYQSLQLQEEKVHSLLQQFKTIIDKQKSEIDNLKSEIISHQKNINNKNSVENKLNQQRVNINNLSSKLYQLKSKSYQQKQTYTLLENQQFSLMENISFYQEDQLNYQTKLKNAQRIYKLNKLKVKIQAQIQNTEEQTQKILQKKINQASLLRTNIKSLDQVLEQCSTKIQQQNFIILALKNKAVDQQHQQQENKLFSQIRDRYQQIYYDDGTNKKWNEYKQYLKYLIQDTMEDDKVDPFYDKIRAHQKSDNSPIKIQEYNQQQKKKRYHKNPKNLKNQFDSINYANSDDQQNQFQNIKNRKKNKKNPNKSFYSSGNFDSKQQSDYYHGKKHSMPYINKKPKIKTQYNQQNSEYSQKQRQNKKPFHIKRIFNLEKNHQNKNNHLNNQLPKQMIKYDKRKLPNIHDNRNLKQPQNKINYIKKQPLSIKDQIKKQIQKKQKNNKKIQIVSVGSSQSLDSGQYIQVQFHKANKNQFSTSNIKAK